MSVPSPTAPSPGGPRVLCVLSQEQRAELDPELQRMQRPGIAFEFFDDPDEALDRFAAAPPDLVLLGMNIEEWEGLELLAMLMQRRPDYRGEAVVVPNRGDPFPPMLHTREASGRSATRELELSGLPDLVTRFAPSGPATGPARTPRKTLVASPRPGPPAPPSAAAPARPPARPPSGPHKPAPPRARAKTVPAMATTASPAGTPVPTRPAAPAPSPAAATPVAPAASPPARPASAPTTPSPAAPSPPARSIPAVPSTPAPAIPRTADLSTSPNDGPSARTKTVAIVLGSAVLAGVVTWLAFGTGDPSPDGPARAPADTQPAPAAKTPAPTASAKPMAAVQPEPAPAITEAVAEDAPNVEAPDPEAPDPEVPEEIQPEPPAAELRTLIALPLRFDQGEPGYEVADAAALDRRLDQFRAALEADPHLRVEIGGHTSAEGSNAFNRKLGRQRATRAKRRLVDAGLPAARLVVRSYAADDPVSTDGHGDADRRVTLRLVD